MLWGGLCWGASGAPSPALQLRRPPVYSSRALQHSNLLQCLAQCAEVTPYLLVMEFCPLVSGHLRGGSTVCPGPVL